jgi:hypothetical protein
MFLAAGWYPGRRVAVRFDRVQTLRTFPLAAELLQAFAGLRVGSCGPGRNHSTSDIEFTSRPSVEDRYAVAQLESPGDDLFPLGEAHVRHMELFLDVWGRLVVYGVPDGSLRVVGESFGEGVERLLLGHAWPEQSRAERTAGPDRPRD